VLGPGGIAHKFAEVLRGCPGGQLAAVASRDRARAAAFARVHGVPHVCDGYSALLDRARIDAVYIATPHHAHAEWAQHALDRGIAVLCEKPITVNAAQAESLVRTSRANRTLLMEALWTRHLPAVRTARAWLAEGRIGAPRFIQAHFGVRLRGAKPEGRMLNPQLAGGCLLDLGVYLISIADYVAGALPEGLRADALIGPTGVDEHVIVQARYPNTCFLHACCSFRADTHNAFVLHGDAGKITLEPSFWNCTSVKLQTDETEGGEVHPHRINGFEYQIDAFHAAFAAGEIEASVIPHEASVRVMRTLDEIRRQIGLRYPCE